MLSKLQLTIRASIMLITLVGIPLIAMFGKTLSEVSQGWWRGREVTENWQSRPAKPVEDPSSSSFKDQLAMQSMRKDLTSAPQASGNDAPRFASTSSAPTQSDRSLGPSPFGASALAPPAMSAPMMSSSSSMGASPFSGSSSLTPSSAPNVPLMPTPSMPSQNSLVASNATRAPNVQPPGLLPLDIPSAQKLSSSSTSGTTSLQPIGNARLDRAVTQVDYQQPQKPVNQPETFESLQQRMKELGASYYKLESASGQYHFFCQVAGPDRAAQDFRASNSDPMAAMRDVAQQLESLNYRTAQNGAAQQPASLQPRR